MPHTPLMDSVKVPRRGFSISWNICSMLRSHVRNIYRYRWVWGSFVCQTCDSL